MGPLPRCRPLLEQPRRSWAGWELSQQPDQGPSGPQPLAELGQGQMLNAADARTADAELQ